MADTTDFIADNFLASTSDLVGVLAHFAVSGRRWSPGHRRARELAQTALCRLFPELPTLEPPAWSPAAAVAAPAHAVRRAVAERSAMGSGPHISVEEKGRRPSRQGRQYCTCGQCTWCLDNARWDRIFNEKFADPGYYGQVTIRHNSTLAEPR